nr:23S rRNA (uracil(1939)-C(5))-methyltransferase RlmD [uncultured Moellerella sp.]
MVQFYSPHRRPAKSRGTTGRIIRVCADNLDSAGQGVARFDGKTIFVQGLLPGEEARIALTEEKRQFAKAKVIERLSDSPQRVEPQCRHFAQCGGCQQQHVDIGLQRETKADTLERLVMRETAISISAKPVIAGNAYGYRRRARLGLQYQAKQKHLVMGFRQSQSNTLVDIKMCPILQPSLEKLLQPLSQCLNHLKSAPKLGHVELINADNVLVIVLRHLEMLSKSDKQQLNEFAFEHQVRILLNSGNDQLEELDDEFTSPSYSIGDTSLAFNPLNFIQVNHQINQQMVAQAIEWLAPQPEDRVLDLFCGMGNFTLPLARYAGEVVGVEGVDSLVLNAKQNAENNQCHNATFFHENLEADIQSQPWAKQGFNKVLLDPARAGAAEVLPHITKLFPEKVVYVSCNPTTLARDSKILLDAGYTLLSLRMLDMFPHTSHLESMALFVRTP